MEKADQVAFFAGIILEVLWAAGGAYLASLGSIWFAIFMFVISLWTGFNNGTKS